MAVDECKNGGKTTILTKSEKESVKKKSRKITKSKSDLAPKLELSPEERKRNLQLKTEAQEIYGTGKAYEYIIDSCSKMHVGDRVAIEGMVLSKAATYVKNCNGLHIRVRGKAGSGKSHCASTVYSHFPRDSVLAGHFSDMSLFYNDGIKPGTVIVMDDQSMSDKMCELMKAQTSDWNMPYEHMSVNLKREGEIRTIPPHCPRWTIMADETGDEQSADRELLFHITDTPEQIAAVKRHIAYTAMNPDVVANTHTTDVSKYIWSCLEERNVVIPFANRIECDDGESVRTYEMIMTLIMSSAIIHAPIREIENDTVVASTDDYDIAVNILNPLLNGSAGSQRDKLSPAQEKIMQYLLSQSSRIITFKELMNTLTLSSSTMSKAATGVKSRANSVGLEKIYGISIIDVDSDYSANTKVKAIDWNRELYLKGNGGTSYFRLLPE